MLLFFKNGDDFATGAARYKYRPATEGDKTNRMILRVQVVGTRIDAVVDTGAPYAILPPQTARLAGFSPEFALRRERMLIRGMRLDGSITRFKEFWGNFPAFIGLTGFLERIRFAIDPLTDTFYFGSMALTEL